MLFFQFWKKIVAIITFKAVVVIRRHREWPIVQTSERDLCQGVVLFKPELNSVQAFFASVADGPVEVDHGLTGVNHLQVPIAQVGRVHTQNPYADGRNLQSNSDSNIQP